ncbi:hypothetical protein BDQ12DRAFT_689416 [Crucibulum laeve]|uniref:Uncharacterized protein n=1 Tax=Crucibulum laeve TaxID=68775 RepID=A0A5C3LQ13_9AGAR|nr:hypothetical protein BDQ12DRAFT_689416 [Crucibulum laeve]
MREMRAQEKAKEDAKRKQRLKKEEERKAKERKAEEEQRARERKEQERIAKEKEAERVRMDAWRAATSYEKERRNKKDLKWSKGWTKRRALDRFMSVLEYFERKSFSEQLPLVNSSVPWPIMKT